jgi:hypothetical protein
MGANTWAEWDEIRIELILTGHEPVVLTFTLLIHLLVIYILRLYYIFLSLACLYFIVF